MSGAAPREANVTTTPAGHVHLRARLDEMGYADLAYDAHSAPIVQRLYADLCDALNFIAEKADEEREQQGPTAAEDHHQQEVQFFRAENERLTSLLSEASRTFDQQVILGFCY